MRRGAAIYCPPGIACQEQQVPTSASEEGTSHLTDDGWAETQRKMCVIESQLVDLGIAVEAIPSRVASDFADFAANSPVQDVAQTSFCHDHKEFVDLLDIQDEKVVVEVSGKVAHDQIYDVVSSTLRTRSGGLQNVVGTEVDSLMHIHENPVNQDFAEHDSNSKQQPKGQPKAKRDKIKRQHSAAVMAVAIDDGFVDVGVGGVSMSNTSQQRKRQHRPSAQATASAGSPSQASDESHEVIAESTQIGKPRGVKANSPPRSKAAQVTGTTSQGPGPLGQEAS